MDNTSLLITIIFTFIIGASLGFYAARLIF